MPTRSWLAPVPPTVAIEIASHRVTVLEIARGGRDAIVAHASEPLPEGAVQPSLLALNIPDPAVVSSALARALTAAGLRSVRRAALVVPDTVARVSLLPFEHVPARSADLDQLIRWQIRKATPFPIETAQMAHFPVHRSGDGATIAAVAARRETIAEYEAIAAALGIHAGIVDLASFNIMNTVVASGRAAAGDWLLVHLAADATTLAILRGKELLFYRHRAAPDEEPLGVLVHRTSMFHQDRLGGGTFAQVWLAGSGIGDQVERSIADRVGVPIQTIDIASAVEVRAGGANLDALPASVGVLLREREVA